MKKLAISLFAILISFSVFAQSERNAERATSATEKMTAVYKLEANQLAEVQTIQARKYRNLGEIESMRETDPSKYILKLRSIRSGTEASYKRIFSEEQKAILHQKRMDHRVSLSQDYTKMQKEGLTKEQMNEKIIEMELEMLEDL